MVGDVAESNKWRTGWNLARHGDKHDLRREPKTVTTGCKTRASRSETRDCVQGFGLVCWGLFVASVEYGQVKRRAEGGV